jgi:CRISPR/Cas system-associated endoribonuclease Cas2
MNVLFDYNNSRVIFIDRESNALDKNYTLRKDMNMQSYGLGYSGEDMYSIFYVQGGEDELGLITTLSDSVPYKDNFLFNFDYFSRNGLINGGSVQNLFENRTNPNSLVNINENLRLLIREEADRIGIIRVNKTNFRILSNAILAGGENSNVDYSNLNKLFKDTVLISSIQTKALTPIFTEK